MTGPVASPWQERALGMALAVEADAAQLMPLVAPGDAMTLARSAAAGAAALARLLKAHQEFLP